MKKIIFVLGLSVLGLGIVGAQQKITTSETKEIRQVDRKKMQHRGVKERSMKYDERSHIDQRVQKLDAKVNLTEEQKVKLNQEYTQISKDAKDLRRANMERYNEATEAVLTQEQLNTLEQERKVRRAEHKRDFNRKSMNRGAHEVKARHQKMKEKE